MQTKSFKATTISTPEGASRKTLTEAFNAWAEDEQPAEIVHVHYFHDHDTHARGYQVVYAGSWRAATRPEDVLEAVVGHRRSV